MKAKAHILLLSCLCLAVSLSAQTAAKPAATASTPAGPALKPVDFKTDPAAMEFAKQAGTQAIGEWMRDFVGKQLGPKAYAVIPFSGDIDKGYFTDAASSEFSNVILGTDYSLYTSMNDPVLEKLNNEMMQELDAPDRTDIFDEATIQKFRRVNVQGLIVGRIAGIYYAEKPTQSGVQVEGFEQKAIQVRVIIRAYENSTGRILWGAEKVAAVDMPMGNIVVKRDWIMKALLYGGGGLGLLLLLFILHRMLLGASRPR